MFEFFSIEKISRNEEFHFVACKSISVHEYFTHEGNLHVVVLYVHSSPPPSNKSDPKTVHKQHR